MHTSPHLWAVIEPRHLTLLPHEVQVWLVDLDRFSEDTRWLSPVQAERYAHLSSNKRIRRRFVTACARRIILAGSMNLPIDAIGFECDNQGKPRLAGNLKKTVRFNISHSGKYALLAIGYKREVGVDIEFHSPLRNIERIIKILHPQEQRELASIPDLEKRQKTFFDLWTCKEAYLKATGAGLRRGLRSIQIPSGLINQPEAEKYRRLSPLPGNWFFLPLNCPQGYSATLVAEGSSWCVRTASWMPSLL